MRRGALHGGLQLPGENAMRGPQEQPDDLSPDPAPPEAVGGPSPLAVSLGELLEAHHSRFVERIRERERKEQE
jgi:hypothetical protein